MTPASPPAEQPDPRDAQMARLNKEITALIQRLAQSTITIDELTGFRTRPRPTRGPTRRDHPPAGSADTVDRIRRLPQRAATIDSCS